MQLKVLISLIFSVTRTDTLLSTFERVRSGQLSWPPHIPHAEKQAWLKDQTMPVVRDGINKLKALGDECSPRLKPEHHLIYEKLWQALSINLFQVDTWMYTWGVTTNAAVELSCVIRTQWRLTFAGFHDPRKPRGLLVNAPYDETRKVELDLTPIEDYLLEKWDSIAEEEGHGAQA